MNAPLLLLSVALLGDQEKPTEADVRALIAELGADRIEVREPAEQRLLALGQRALPSLRKAVEGDDNEVAARAMRLVRILEVAVQLTPAFRKAWPGVAETLAFGKDEVWTSVFLKMAKHKPPLSGKDFDALVVRAFRGAVLLDDRTSVCHAAARRGCQSAVPELVRLAEDEVAIVRSFCVISTVTGRLEIPNRTPGNDNSGTAKLTSTGETCSSVS